MTFSFSGALPQTKADITSAQLRARFNDVLTELNTLNPSALRFPNTTSAAQYQAFLLNAAKTGFTTNHVLRSNVALEHDDGNGTANEALVSDGDGTTSWSPVLRSNVPLEHDAGNGTSGQLLRSDGDGTTSWASVTTSTAPETKNTSFTTAANAQYMITTGTVTVTLHSPAGAGEQFSIMPLLGARDFTTTPPTLAGAMQVNGATIDSNYLNENVRYNFISFDGTNWWVSGEVFDV